MHVRMKEAKQISVTRGCKKTGIDLNRSCGAWMEREFASECVRVCVCKRKKELKGVDGRNGGRSGGERKGEGKAAPAKEKRRGNGRMEERK